MTICRIRFTSHAIEVTEVHYEFRNAIILCAVVLRSSSLNCPHHKWRQLDPTTLREPKSRLGRVSLSLRSEHHSVHAQQDRNGLLRQPRLQRQRTDDACKNTIIPQSRPSTVYDMARASRRRAASPEPVEEPEVQEQIGRAHV